MGIVVGVVAAIVLATIIAVILLVKKKNRRVATRRGVPITSATSTVTMTQEAPNDNVRPVRLQFPPPGMQNDPPPSVSTVPRPPQTIGAPYPPYFSPMNVGYGAYPPSYERMTVIQGPPPPYSSS